MRWNGNVWYVCISMWWSAKHGIIYNINIYIFIVCRWNIWTEPYISRVAKLLLASRMLIHYKLDYQGAWPPLLYMMMMMLTMFATVVVKLTNFMNRICLFKMTFPYSARCHIHLNNAWQIIVNKRTHTHTHTPNRCQNKLCKVVFRIIQWMIPLWE